MQQAGKYSWARHTLESGSGGQEDGHFWRSYVRLAKGPSSTNSFIAYAGSTPPPAAVDGDC